MQDNSSEKLSDVSVHAGFPNPAADTDRKGTALSLDQLLLAHPSSTYLFRLSGHGWAREGIADGDIAIVDRACGARPSDLVVAWHLDDFLLTRRHLLPKDVAPWGTVTAIVHLYNRGGGDS
jgi:DNA polymerase V